MQSLHHLCVICGWHPLLIVSEWQGLVCMHNYFRFLRTVWITWQATHMTLIILYPLCTRDYRNIIIWRKHRYSYTRKLIKLLHSHAYLLTTRTEQYWCLYWFIHIVSAHQYMLSKQSKMGLTVNVYPIYLLSMDIWYNTNYINYNVIC